MSGVDPPEMTGSSQSGKTAARALERAASPLAKSKLIDPRTDRYQPSTSEALYLTNHPEVQKLLHPGE